MTADRRDGSERRVVLVTGLSGAGRSTCLKALEDLDYEAVDNLPLALLPALLDGEPERARVAIGVDSRSRAFRADTMIAEVARMRADPTLAVTLLFLDSDPAVLERRFSETRRRHPLAADRPVADGVRLEREMMAPLRAAADTVIDTSEMRAQELRQHIWAAHATAASRRLVVTVISFSYRVGLPRDADLVFDVRFLSNPHYDPELRPRDGRDPAVQRHIEADSAFAPFIATLQALLAPLLPAYGREGKHYLTIAIGCTGGQHRSVFVAERLAAWLTGAGEQVSLRHRDVPVR